MVMVRPMLLRVIITMVIDLLFVFLVMMTSNLIMLDCFIFVVKMSGSIIMGLWRVEMLCVYWIQQTT
jgi:hypothetical protein